MGDPASDDAGGNEIWAAYISSAFQREGKISKNVTDRQTDIDFIIIYISSAFQREGKISKNVTDR